MDHLELIMTSIFDSKLNGGLPRNIGLNALHLMIASQKFSPVRAGDDQGDDGLSVPRAIPRKNSGQ